MQVPKYGRRWCASVEVQQMASYTIKEPLPLASPFNAPNCISNPLPLLPSWRVPAAAQQLPAAGVRALQLRNPQ